MIGSTFFTKLHLWNTAQFDFSR